VNRKARTVPDLVGGPPRADLPEELREKLTAREQTRVALVAADAALGSRRLRESTSCTSYTGNIGFDFVKQAKPRGEDRPVGEKEIEQLRLDIIALIAQVRHELAQRDERLRAAVTAQGKELNQLRLAHAQSLEQQSAMLDILLALYKKSTDGELPKRRSGMKRQRDLVDVLDAIPGPMMPDRPVTADIASFGQEGPGDDPRGRRRGGR
jgi:hypothetical protein